LILNKIKNYYYFRFKQFLRIANSDFGSFFSYLIFGLVIFYYDFKYDWLFLIYYIFPALYFINKRKDIPFIKNLFINLNYFILLLENLFLYIVIFFLINSKTSFWVDVTGLILCFSYPVINLKKYIWTKNINLSYLPLETFEWKSFFRKNPLYLIVFFLLLLLSSYHPFTLSIMIFLFCDIINSVYSVIEPKEIYSSYFTNNTLNEKLNKSLLIINAIILIPSIFCFLLNVKLYFIIIICISVLNMFTISIILHKYSNYNIDTSKIRNHNMGQIIALFISIFLIFPWLFDYFQLKKNAQLKINKYV